MAKGKTTTKVDPAAYAIMKGAITNDATIQVAAGKNDLLRYAPYVYAFAKATKEQREALLEGKVALEVLNAARDATIRMLVKNNDPLAREVAEIANTRVSEFKRIMRFGAYDCHKTVLRHFDGASLKFGDILALVDYCTTTPDKNGGRAKAKPFNAPAPSENQCTNAIKARRAEKNGNGNGEARARNATKALDTVKALVEGFKLWLDDHKAIKAKASTHLNEMIRAAQNLQKLAKSV
jgi:hypothetical protein